MWYRFTWPLMKAVLRGTFAVLGGFRAQGTRNVPRSGAVLICPNHISDADPPAVAVAVPRNAFYMAKHDLFEVPVLGYLMRHFRAFPIKRDSADRAALRKAEELLQNGEAVVIFAEGGGNEEGTLQPLYPGAMLIALKTRVPVVPVALVNTNEVWEYGSPTPKRAGVPVSVTFGEPLDLSDLYGKKGAVDEATRRLTERLAQMLNQPVPQGKPKPREDSKAESPKADKVLEQEPTAVITG